MSVRSDRGSRGTKIFEGLLLLAAIAVGCRGGSGEGPTRKAAAEVATSAAAVTGAADNLRTGWYPDEPLLSPSIVTSPAFTQLFAVPINGGPVGVTAQPLVSNGTLLVVTSTNDIYGFDPRTGAEQWTRNLGGGHEGVAGTPAIDDSTHTAYFFSKTTANQFFAHGIDVTTGAEQPGFPVPIQGSAANAPSITFNPVDQFQRTGVLLMDGVFYGAFGAHGDRGTYYGLVIGVSTAGSIVTIWAAETDASSLGAGIWQSGGGLASDRPGNILLTTGNGPSPTTPTPGYAPPGTLGEAVVRLAVQPDGSLQATDFFVPYNADNLNMTDGDLGSGAPMALPSPYYGTSDIPDLMVQFHKRGIAYVLNRDALGGFAMGPGGTDAVLAKMGPRGGVWGRPTAFPPYVYVTPAGTPLDVYQYGTDSGGQPTISWVATSLDVFGYGSSSPIVTSNGTTPGSALLWTVWSADVTNTNAELRAYDPVPSAGVLRQVFSTPVGSATRWALPGVRDGVVYVATKDHVYGFGAPAAALVGAPLAFGNVVVGQTGSGTATFTASQACTVSSVAIDNPAFTAGMPSPPLPASLNPGDTLTVPVTTIPASLGPYSGVLTATGSFGSASAGLSARGESAGGYLDAEPNLLLLGTAAIGDTLSGNIVLQNQGATGLTLSQIGLPSAPFTLTGAPPLPAFLDSWASLVLTVSFSSPTEGAFTDSVTFTSDADNGTVSVGLSASAGQPGVLTISPLTLAYPDTAVGSQSVLSFTVSNTGGSDIHITKSKPPILGTFVAGTTLAEGTDLPPNTTLTETVTFQPMSVGTFDDLWEINADGQSSLTQVLLNGNGIPPTNLVVDGDFENGLTGWNASRGVVVLEQATVHGGANALQIGSTSPLNGYSIVTQYVSIPPSGTTTLTFWAYFVSTDTIAHDFQKLRLVDAAGNTLATPLRVCSDAMTWQQVSVDLTPYASQSVGLQFSAYDDNGPGDPTWFYLDDVIVTNH